MSKKKILIFGACLVGLFALQVKFVLPFMYDIAASDLFLVDSKDSASPLPVNNEMTALAFANCNSHIKNDLDEDKSVAFADKPTKVWTLGNYEYLVNADVEIVSKDAPSTMQHYVCRIQYKNGDDISGSGNYENWNIEGVTGLEV